MSDCDVSSRLFTLHYCTIVAVATSDTAAHVGRGTVLYRLTDGPSNDIDTNRLSPYRYLQDRWPQLEPGQLSNPGHFQCLRNNNNNDDDDNTEFIYTAQIKFPQMCSWHSNKISVSARMFCSDCNVDIGQLADCSIFWLW